MKATMDNVFEVATSAFQEQVAGVKSDGEDVLDELDSMLNAIFEETESIEVAEGEIEYMEPQRQQLEDSIARSRAEIEKITGYVVEHAKRLGVDVELSKVPKAPKAPKVASKKTAGRSRDFLVGKPLRHWLMICIGSGGHRTAREMADACLAGGFQTTSKDFRGVVYQELRQCNWFQPRRVRGTWGFTPSGAGVYASWCRWH